MNNKIAGYENEKRELRQLRHMLHHAAEYREKGVRIPRGVALYGEPGIGKTVLARSIADDGIGLVELRAANCCSQDAGNAIRETFEVAREQAPCVLLLDELDKIAGTSESYFMENNDDVRKILLQEIDDLQDTEDVLVVATCNDTDCLGSALLRPGRFDRVIAVQAPDEPTRRKILELYFTGLKLKQRLDLDHIAKLTRGYTGAELECLVNETGLHVLEERRKVVTEKDVRTVMDRLALQGRERMPSLEPEELRKVAVHEAGHAVVGLALAPESVIGATVLSQGNSAGHVQICMPGGCASVRQVEDEVTILLAGRKAEQLVDGEIYMGSEIDLKFAAHKILGLATDQAAYGYRFLIGTLPEMLRIGDSEAGRDALGNVVETRLNILAARAETILTECREAHAKIVQALIDRKSLTREELLGLFLEEDEQAA